MHATSTGTDRALLNKLSSIHSSHAHFLPQSSGSSVGFTIKHFAGDVSYNVTDFADKNKDTLNRDLILVLKASVSPLVAILYPDTDPIVASALESSSAAESTGSSNKHRVTTAGYKIRNQCEALVQALMKCTPHYIRCIKSNDKKAANDFNQERVLHQCKYLGLLENVRVRRAGFAYRQEFHKFLHRFKLLSESTWPSEWTGTDKNGCKAILKSVITEATNNVNANSSSSNDLKSILTEQNENNIQLGKNKIFIRHPETLFALDNLKYSKINSLITRIQRAWRRYQSNKHFIKLRRAVSSYLSSRKARRRDSFYRPFQGIYIDYYQDFELRT